MNRLGALLGTVVAVLAVLALAGCGEGSDPSTLTKAEFIKQANAVCAGVREKIKTESQAHTTPEEIANMSGSLELIETIVIPILRREAGELRALGAPSGDKAEVAAILVAIEKGVEEVEEDPGALVPYVPSALTRAHRIASEYGLKGCARS